MILQYAEITLHKETTGWSLLNASHSFWEMTGFTPDTLQARCQGQFLQLLSTSDMPSAEEFLVASTMPNAVCPWLFSLLCADQTRVLFVLMQLVQVSDGGSHMLLRLHDAGFLGEQIERLDRRIVTLERSIPSGMCQVLNDEHLTVIWYNDHYLDILGYTEEQFARELRSRATGYIYPEDQAKVAQLMQEAAEQGHSVVTLEMRIVSRSGDVRWLLASLGFTGETVNGYPVLYSIGIDITAQHRAQQLELDAERMRLAMRQTSTYILEYDVLARRLLASDTLQRYFGLDGNVDDAPETLVNSGLLVPTCVEDMQEMFLRLERGEEHVEATVGMYDRSRDGAELWFRLRLSSIYSQDGKPVKAILLAEDVTERHIVEMRYREEEKRRAAITFDLDFSFQCNLTTQKILSLNEAKFSFIDFSRDISYRALIRQTAAQKIYPEDRGEYLRKLNPDYILEQFENGVPEFTLEFRGLDRLHDNGQYHWYSGDIHVIREPVHGDICAYVYTKNIDTEKNQEMELRRHAEQDALTGLYNRYTVELQCNRLLERLPKKHLGVLYMMDLDNFKFLNDTYGHLRGDEMLRQAAICLRENLSENALLGRLGGDELVIYQPDCASVHAAQVTAQCLCDALRELGAGAGVVTLSVGIALAPRDGKTFSELYHCADAALYQAKRSGKNRWAVYTKDPHETGMGANRFPVSREWLLEESSDIIYVCDFFSYDLLYMNELARNTFGVGRNEYQGRKCYEVLQSKSQPCEFCTSHLLCRESFYTWQHRNEAVGKSLLLRDRIIDWYGIPARIEIATDVSAMDVRNRELSQQVEIDTIIISCLRIINSNSSLSSSANQLLEQVSQFYGADRAFIMDYHAGSNLLLPCYEWCAPGPRTIQALFGRSGIHPDEPLRRCIAQHENFLLDHPELPDGEASEHLRALYDAGVVCQRCVPFYIDQTPVGIIGVDNPTVFRDEMTVLETLSYFIAEELSQSQLSARLSYLSYHDSLTGLSNRNRYVEHLTELKCEQLQTLGVALADLNALKDINKLRGHAAGDEVVRRAAQLLRDSFPDAQIFRLSGDEFVIHCMNLDRMTFLEQVKFLQEGSDSLQAHGISVGYAWTDHHIDSSQLMLQATDIMLMRKRQYYQEAATIGTPGKRNDAALRELADCLQQGKFLLYLQPKADCADFRLDGAEALVRFFSEETGLIPPDSFIPLLEQEHMIQYLDLYVFGEVCSMLSRWRTQGRPPLTVSLNFSRQTLLEPDLLKKLIELTDQHNVPRDLIEVEITESLGDYESTTIAEIGAGIKSAGFRLALDDFGSHYTNMAMLSTVPVDVLKLDRGLVCNVMSSQANRLVLKSILSLCRELGISSIAEGVETEEQLALLRSLQCDAIQGYLFGRPVCISQFEAEYLPKP